MKRLSRNSRGVVSLHKAAEPAFKEEYLRLKWCKEGEAKITKGYQLPAQWVIHTVGPVWESGGYDEEETLASYHRNCLKLALTKQVKTIVFPAISTGTYGFPLDKASKIAVTVIASFLRTESSIDKVILVCFDELSFF